MGNLVGISLVPRIIDICRVDTDRDSTYSRVSNKQGEANSSP